MAINDKRGLLSRPHDLREAVIEIGCGRRKRIEGSIGVDVLDADHVDIVGDALAVLQALPEGCGRLVTSSHFPCYEIRYLVGRTADISSEKR
jgi:hypothetical protein